ncbi:hypothetical protein [Methanimicrococcus blatticola]|uniref:hypothetical protein n=1 Tax=Methanimicrococcus blatticola TaxID=91560 RepID=UPI001414F7CF|nr:hypothetical protein [Methanimicrococcus blatticola]MBZ3936331.1 hypothetical protein [Methanimicrococcus blatticola]MCC2508335.1 hypothetical protein [Methanimicrococcus blatticola]
MLRLSALFYDSRSLARTEHSYLQVCVAATTCRLHCCCHPPPPATARELYRF